MTNPYVSEYRESHLAEWRDTDMAELRAIRELLAGGKAVRVDQP